MIGVERPISSPSSGIVHGTRRKNPFAGFGCVDGMKAVSAIVLVLTKGKAFAVVVRIKRCKP